MRQILFSMLVGLSCLTSFAQTTAKVGTVYESIRSVFPGNPDEITVTIDPSDSAKVVAVNTFYVTGGLATLDAQPTVTRTGLTVLVRFSNVSLIPVKARVKFKIGGITRQVWRYDVSESNTTKTNPSSLTIVSYEVLPAESVVDIVQTTNRLNALEAVPLATTATFTNAIPFNAYYKDLGTICFSQNRLTLNGQAVYVGTGSTLTPNTTGARPGATSLVRIVADGTTPNLSAFKLTTGSQNFVPTSGTTNICGFFFDGLYYWLTMFQESGATPADIIAPTLTSAQVADNLRTRIVLTYSEPLDATAGLSAADFTVSGKTISSVAVSGSLITVDVSSPFVYSDAITLSGGTGKIRDPSLNVSTNLSARAVTNSITNLVFASASVADASRNQVVFVFNKAVDNTALPATSAFSFSPSKTVSSVIALGSSLTVTLGGSFALGDVITASYTQPGTNPLKDLYGSFWSSGSYSITNNIVAPLFSSAAIADNARSRIVITANKPVTIGSTASSDFAVSGKTVSAVSVSGSSINVDVSSPFIFSDTPTITYTSSSGKLQDAYGSLFPTRAALPITNNVQTWLPITWSTTSLTVASGVWSPIGANAGTTNFGQSGIVSTAKLAAGQDGGVQEIHNTTNSYFSVIGLKTSNAIGGYGTFTYGAYMSSGGTLSRVDAGTVTTVGGGLVATGERLRLFRTGTTVKLQKVGTDNVTVTDLWTFAASSSTDLYPAVDVRGDGKNNTPESYNVH